MSALGGGEPPSPTSISANEAFMKLIGQVRRKPNLLSIPKSVKKLDEVPKIALLEEQPIKIALAVAERGLIGQFMGLWPSAKTTDDWIHRNWRP